MVYKEEEFCLLDREAKELIKPKVVDDMSEETKKAWDYFMTGSKGKEPNAFLHELREAMLQPRTN